MLILHEGNILDPVSVEEFKAHMRLEFDVDDDLIKGMLRSVTEMVETHLGLSLLEKVWILTAEPNSAGIVQQELLMGPLISIENVKGLSSSGQRIPIKRYRLNQINLRRPVFSCYSNMVIEIMYRSGFGSTPKSIPSTICQAILLIAASMYENRTGEGQMPKIAVDLLKPYRQIWL